MAVLVKTLNGLAYASVKTRDGLAVASISKINGLDATSGGGGTNFLLDTFTDADGTNLTAHTGELGATWTQVFQASGGAMIIDSNRLYGGTALGGVYVVKPSGSSPSADYDVTISFRWLSVIDTEFIVDARGDGSGSNGYRIRIQNTQIKLLKVVSNTESDIGAGSSSQTWSTGTDYSIVLRMVGTTISAVLDGSTIISGTDSTYSSAGLIDMVSVNNVAGSTTTGLHLNSITGTS